MVSAETRRRRPRSRRIARPAGSPCMRATVKVSARVEHVVLPDLVETAHSYTKCVFCSQRSQCSQGLRFARIFTFHPGAGYNGYIGYKPGEQDVLGRAPPRCGEDSQDQGTLRAARARRASRLQTRDQCATNTYRVLFWSNQLKLST